MQHLVGGGATGSVYRAIDRSSGMPVAVKLFHELARDTDLNLFLREMRVLAELQHPGLVRYLDHGQSPEGRPYVVMEWLEGEDLSRLLARAPMGMSDAVELVRRASRALAAVHARGLVHRDLKPSNIYLHRKAAGSSVKLLDFKTVRPLEAGKNVSLSTPCFLSPEQARGLEPDARADVYALGAVLFLLLTGRHVFEADHPVAYMGRVLLEDAPRARSLRADVPVALDQLLASMLERDPAGRPSDAAEVARRLSPFADLPNGAPSAVATIPPPCSAPDEPEVITQPFERANTPLGGPSIREKRVVAVMLAAISGPGLSPELEDKTRRILGERARLEMLSDGQILAALGLERTAGNEAIRMARAALSLARAVPQSRVAIATGHAFPGRRGLAGEALERVIEQLQQLEGPGIRVDLATQALLNGLFLLREDAAGAVLLREDVSDTEPRPLLGRTTPMVGRSEELQRLLRLCHQVVHDSQPRAALVVGATGVGKSRLRKHLVQQLRSELPALDVIMVRANPMLEHRGLTDIGRALRARMGIRDGEPAEAQALKLARYLSQRPDFPAQSIDAVAEFVGAHEDDCENRLVRPAHETPDLVSARIYYAIEMLLRQDARTAPVLLILEEANIVDETTMALADWLLDCTDLRLCILAVGRPDVDVRYPDLWKNRRMMRLTLGPLGREDCERMVTLALPQLPPLERNRLVERAQGNPLFLEELIRHAAGGHQRVLPASVQALIQARMDRLSDSQRQVLRAASVFGSLFWTSGVATVCGRPVDDDLQQLEAAELVVAEASSRIDGHSQWGFPNALVQESAYASLLDEDRPHCHRKALEWLLTVGEHDLAAVARHAEAAGDPSQAARLYAQAAARAYRNGNLEATLAFASRGADRAQQADLRAECLLQRAQVLAWLGRYDDQFEAAEAAGALSAPGTDLWAEARRLAGVALREHGHAQKADELFSTALQQCDVRKLSPSVRSRLLAEWSRALVDTGRPREARAAAERAIRAAEQMGDTKSISMLGALDARSLALNFLGDFSAAIEAIQGVLRLADQLGETVLATRARNNLGSALNRIGYFEEGRQVLARALQDARLLRMRPAEGFATHNLGRSHGRLGDIDGAIDLQERALAIGEETRHQRLVLLARVHLARMLMLRAAEGELERAGMLIDAACTDAQPFADIEARLAKVQLARAHGDPMRALALCTDAFNRLATLGTMEDGEEALRLMHAELLLALGHEAQADESLRIAYDVVMARCARLGRPEHRDRYLSSLPECRRIVELATQRLSVGSRH